MLKAGYTHVVDADLKSYFDTIPHDLLMALVATKVSDGKVLALIDAFLHQGVMDGLAEWTPEAGTPQGAVITPPTMLQTTLLGATFKRGRTHPVNDAHLPFIDFDLLDQGTNDLLSCCPAWLT